LDYVLVWLAATKWRTFVKQSLRPPMQLKQHEMEDQRQLQVEESWRLRTYEMQMEEDKNKEDEWSVKTVRPLLINFCFKRGLGLAYSKAQSQPTLGTPNTPLYNPNASLVSFLKNSFSPSFVAFESSARAQETFHFWASLVSSASK